VDKRHLLFMKGVAPGVWPLGAWPMGSYSLSVAVQTFHADNGVDATRIAEQKG